jgi:tetratricopeptide (TPR) repeat protein
VAREGRAFVDAEHPGPPGSPAGPLVGRAGELLLLLARAEAAGHGGGQVAGVVGAPGIGKSRLVRELAARLDGARHAVVEAGCAAHTAAFAFHPVAALVRGVVGISPSGDAARARAALAATAGPESVPHLLRVLGIEAPADGQAAVAPELARAGVFAAVRRLLLGAAAARPLVLVIEDVHWADRSSLELLESLVTEMARARLLLVVTYRPDGEPAFMRRPIATRVALAPLGPEDSRGLVEAVVPPERASVIARLVERAEGNPLFLEELALAVRGGALLDAVPDSLEGILRLRLERLAPAERRLVQIASVLGREPPRALLAALWDGPEPLEPLLDALDRADLVYPAGDALRFKHALTRDAAYGSLLESERARLHERAARALEQREDADEACELIAHHHARGTDRDRAVEFLIRAQARTYRRFALDQAEAYFREARALLATLPATPANLRHLLDALLNQCDTIGYLGRLEEYGPVLEETTAVARRIDDAALVSKVRSRRGCLYWWTGRYREAIEELEPSLRFAPDSTDEEYNAGVWLVWAYRVAGRHATLLELAPRLIEKLAARGSIIHRAYTEGAVVAALLDLGRIGEALRTSEALLARAEAVRDPVARCFASWNLGRVLLASGDVDRARALADHALALSPTPLDRLYTQIVHGWVHAHAGTPGAVEETERAMRTAEGVGAGLTAFAQFIVLPEVYALGGRLDDARRAAETHLALAEDRGMRVVAAAARRYLAEIALESGDLAAARARLEEVLPELEALGVAHELEVARADLGELEVREGAEEAGRARARAALRALDEMGAGLAARRIRRRLGLA